MVEVPMTDEQFASASLRLREHGMELNGPSGTLTKEGITATYQHADGKLTIEIVKRPFFLPLSLIESKLKAAIEQSLASESKPASTA
jgi:hypothetical protein